MTRWAARWPFVFVVDSRQVSINWVLVGAPVVSSTRQEQLAQLRRAGFRFVGISSDGTFPLLAQPDPLDYGALCEAWCHCFRDPEQFLPRGLPNALISASDFTDYYRIHPEATWRDTAAIPRFDFIYAGATEPWKKVAKNWDLARRCIPKICRELGLRCLLIGAPSDDISAMPELLFEPTLPWQSFLMRLARARFLFVPNLLDASPRVLAEALCLDVPVVVNRQILGGWKYVNAFTGTFFDGEPDVVAAVRMCLDAPKSPRRWFRANYGPCQSGRRLLRLLRAIDPAISERSHLALAEQIDV